jgi:predicted phosphodiesterase
LNIKRKKDVRSALVFSDCHIPFFDPACEAILLETVARLDPDICVINGDFVDCHDVSSFANIEPVDLAYEFEEGRKFLRKLRKRYDGPIHFTEGNHEYRLTRYLATQARELQGVRGLSIHDQLDMRELGIAYHQNRGCGSYKFGPISIRHGERVRKYSAVSARWEFEDLVQDSLVMGHTHRQGLFCTNIKKNYWAAESGCTCLLEADYAPHPNWQQGFAIVRLSDKHAQCELISVEKGNTIVSGETYTYLPPPKK